MNLLNIFTKKALEDYKNLLIVGYVHEEAYKLIKGISPIQELTPEQEKEIDFLENNEELNQLINTRFNKWNDDFNTISSMMIKKDLLSIALGYKRIKEIKPFKMDDIEFNDEGKPKKKIQFIQDHEFERYPTQAESASAYKKLDEISKAEDKEKEQSQGIKNANDLAEEIGNLVKNTVFNLDEREQSKRLKEVLDGKGRDTKN